MCSMCPGIILLQIDPDLHFTEQPPESCRQFGLVWLGNMHVAWLQSCTWKDFLRVDPDLQKLQSSLAPDSLVLPRPFLSVGPIKLSQFL